MQQCNQVGVANCVACSVPDKTLMIPAAMPGSLSFKLTIKKKKLQLVRLWPAQSLSLVEIVNGDYDLATGDDGSFYYF